MVTNRRDHYGYNLGERSTGVEIFVACSLVYASRVTTRLMLSLKLMLIIGDPRKLLLFYILSSVLRLSSEQLVL